MSEAYLSSVITQMMAQVGNLLSQEIRLLFGLEDELKELEYSISKLQAKLLGAEAQQAENQAIKNFLIRIKDSMYDADDLFDQFYCESLMRKPNEKVSCFFFKSNPLSFRLPMAHKINNTRKIIDKLYADIRELNIIEHIRDVRDKQIRQRETHSFVREDDVIGRDDEKEEIMGKLFDPNVENNVSVIAIVGIGGLGKTTLAQSLYNNTKVKTHFELRMWVCISEEFDLETILGKIIESATGKKPTEIQNLDSWQSQMQQEIKEKKYLLVLDDVWNENYDEWMKLQDLLMGGASGSRILITTRSQRVAEIASSILAFPIEGLSEDNSWLLFEKIAFRKGEGDQAIDPNFIEVGKEIVEKLNGVPLAIRTIGRVLYFKTSHSEWTSFKDNELSTIIQREGDMMSILKISYNNLPTLLKPCFAYCSLFPKDFLFDENELVKQWIAQGFINQSQCQGKSMEDVGYDYLEELYWRSLFQEKQTNIGTDKQEFKMHDLIHDLAQWVSDGEHILLKNISDLQNIDIRARHVSFDAGFDLKEENPTSLREVKKLRSLLYLPKYSSGFELSLNDQVFGMMISCFTHVRALNLCLSNISVVPESINQLKQLRYLNLSFNHDIELLPNSITELKSLQTLDLTYCSSLKELPRSTSDLVNLRHLSIKGCNLSHMPEGLSKLTCLQTLDLSNCRSVKELPRSISDLVNLRHLSIKGCNLSHMPEGLSKLTCLQTMNLFVLGEENGNGLDQLKGLDNLRGELEIKGLELLRFNSTRALTSQHAELKKKKNLQSIELRWGSFRSEIDEVGSCVDKTILDNLEPHSDIKSLEIEGYRGLVLSNWLYSLSNLVNLNISDCGRLQCLPQLDQLRSLNYLCLWRLTSLEFIFNISGCSSSTIFFPSLQFLSLGHMPELKKWWKGDQHSFFPQFPALTNLVIKNCNELDMLNFEEMHRKAVKSLRSLNLSMLSGLVSLPNGLQYVTTLQDLCVHQCENLEALPEWIDNLTSLLSLTVCGSKFKSLPHGIRNLIKLQRLTIDECHKDLKERCKPETGEYWPLISHIPNVELLEVN